ncbi:MAG: asparagine synthase (glutamine-hydrolyzing) [Phycisphaerales bacterium]
MCGILAIATVRGRRLTIDDAAIARMRDAMTHRGPDASGAWRDGNVALAHRRLIVIDPSPEAGQPMRTADRRLSLVYNGELYNDADLRRELGRAGVAFRTASDTETVLHALAVWGGDAGREALPRLRGMYAFALHDAREHTIMAARDPLGVKPLYWWRGRAADGASLLILASEIQAILAHPDVPRRPDAAVVSSYLTTIRTTLGDRTLFDGVRTVRPGESIVFDLSGDTIRARHATTPRPAVSVEPGLDPVGSVRAAVEDSVRRHLRSDVPICCLLSGGLDSTIAASVAYRAIGELHTYCSGAAPPASGGMGGPPVQDDFAFARLAAEGLGTRHSEAPVSRALFRERWPAMVRATGLPLSTPNEVAINEVACRIRADGRIVTLSGEGADELFAGYEAPMLAALKFEESLSTEPAARATGSVGSTQHRAACASRRARFQIDSNAWVALDAKPAILAEPIARAIEGDAVLIETYEREWDAIADGPDDDPLQSHLRFHRRTNLAGLLLRLDSATMLAGVEGRTPFADTNVLALAEALPMAWKFRRGTTIETKRALREAFAPDLPSEIVTRAKASFPLPFQEWVADAAPALRDSPFAREWFSEAAVATVAAEPTRLWQLAWPMVNLSLWGDR